MNDRPETSPADMPSDDAPLDPADAPPPLDMAQLLADLDAAEAEEDAGHVVPWEEVEAELRRSAAECRAEVARHRA